MRWDRLSGNLWLAIRRPLALALLLGCAVSLMASGRVDAAAGAAGDPVLELRAAAELVGWRSAASACAQDLDEHSSRDTRRGCIWVAGVRCLVGLCAGRAGVRKDGLSADLGTCPRCWRRRGRSADFASSASRARERGAGGARRRGAAPGLLARSLAIFVASGGVAGSGVEVGAVMPRGELVAWWPAGAASLAGTLSDRVEQRCLP